MGSEFSNDDFKDLYSELNARLEKQTNRIAEQIREINVNLSIEEITQRLIEIAQKAINNDDTENVYFV